MSFDVAAESYDRFMGRFSRPLAVLFADAAEVGRGQQAVDVGCGPGALTEELVHRLGAGAVTALDPSEPFVAAARARLPGVRVERATAEALPLADGSVDRALAQLVVHFMTDPVAGLAEMGRTTRPGGLVAACVWDNGGGRGPLSPFWRAVGEIDPDHGGEDDRAGTRAGHLARLCGQAGLRDVRESELTTSLRCETFDEWWAPFELGVGPGGAYLAALDDDGRAEVRDRCAARMPAAPFTVEATAWCVTARP